ncbi:MAG: hypothetical protein GWP03_04475 [Proteobacteria bacterium]|nr:hypothetical protein [Pseudomonadota bacterium]
MTAKKLVLLGKILSFIPRNILYFFGGIIGMILPSILTERTKILYKNYSVIAPGKNRKRLAKREFQHIVWNYIDFLRIPYLKKEDILRICPTSHLKLLDEYRNKKGLVLIPAHVGNFDFASSFISSFNGVKTVTVAESSGPGEEMFNLFASYRGAFGMRVLKLEDKLTMFNLYRALQGGEMVILLGDRDILGNGETILFFNKNASFPKGPYYLAYKLKKPLFAAFIMRNPRRRREYYVIEKEIKFDDLFSIDKKNAIKTIMERFVRELENVIREYPDQWLVFQPPW